MANNNNNKILNVPNLRFPEFTGEWKKCRLCDVATLTKGVGISKGQRSPEGHPCILYGELYTTYKSEIITDIASKTNIHSANLVKSKHNDIIIPSSGETAIDISTARCVQYNDVLLGSDLNIIRLKDGNNGSFFSYQLNGVRKRDIAKVAQGVSVVHLYGETLKTIKVTLPGLAEQNKISSLLCLIDQRISTQNKIIEDFKKLMSAIYQNVFYRNEASFVSLGDICRIVKGQQLNGELLSKDGDYYVMNGGILPSGYYSDYNTEPNTISISEGGNSCGYVQLNNERFWSSGHCYSLQNLTSDINLLYLYHYLKYCENSIMKLRIGSGLPNIQKKDLAAFKIFLPKKERQKQLVSIFTSVDTMYSIEKRLLSEYVNQKSFLLQQMFI